MTIAYITKYALSFGIYKTEVEINGDMATQPGDKIDGHSYFPQYFHGKDWHLSEGFALERAEEMRIAKLKSLDKQMKKISALKFDIKERTDL